MEGWREAPVDLAAAASTRPVTTACSPATRSDRTIVPNHSGGTRTSSSVKTIVGCLAALTATFRLRLSPTVAEWR